MQNAECKIAPDPSGKRKRFPALVTGLIVDLKRRLGVCRMREVIFFTFMFDVPSTRVTLEPLGLLLCPERQSKQNALLDKESRSPFAQVLSLCFIRQ